MPIGRLSFEISGNSSRLNQELQKAIATAKDAGLQVTRAGQLGGAANLPCNKVNAYQIKGSPDTTKNSGRFPPQPVLFCSRRKKQNTIKRLYEDAKT